MGRIARATKQYYVCFSAPNCLRPPRQDRAVMYSPTGPGHIEVGEWVEWWSIPPGTPDDRIFGWLKEFPDGSKGKWVHVECLEQRRAVGHFCTYSACAWSDHIAYPLCLDEVDAPVAPKTGLPQRAVCLLAPDHDEPHFYKVLSADPLPPPTVDSVETGIAIMPTRHLVIDGTPYVVEDDHYPTVGGYFGLLREDGTLSPYT